MIKYCEKQLQLIILFNKYQKKSLSPKLLVGDNG